MGRRLLVELEKGKRNVRANTLYRLSVEGLTESGQLEFLSGQGAPGTGIMHDPESLRPPSEPGMHETMPTPGPVRSNSGRTDFTASVMPESRSTSEAAMKPLIEQDLLTRPLATQPPISR